MAYYEQLLQTGNYSFPKDCLNDLSDLCALQLIKQRQQELQPLDPVHSPGLMFESMEKSWDELFAEDWLMPLDDQS